MGPGQLEHALPMSGDNGAWSVLAKLFQRNHKSAPQEREPASDPCCLEDTNTKSNTTRQTGTLGPFTCPSFPSPALEEPEVVGLMGSRWNTEHEETEQISFYCRFPREVKPSFGERRRFKVDTRLKF